ncbi:hypothetical protein HAX54_010996 [Datura stramonium]|uniref:Bet v I/Major latex protein domain-containing protein n=1 Tax=Datura stramonium TaxID=4076 RepID=A0ABS8TIQ1_DATST|nr:hypothetical protein [Datura stramonium]
MRLEGKLVSEINIKCDRDVFHEIYRYRPYHISDGKDKVVKERIEEIDKEKKLVKVKVIGGDILEEYKSISFTIHVESKEPIDVVGHLTPLSSYFDDASDPYVRVHLAPPPPSSLHSALCDSRASISLCPFGFKNLEGDLGVLESVLVSLQLAD